MKTAFCFSSVLPPCSCSNLPQAQTQNREVGRPGIQESWVANCIARAGFTSVCCLPNPSKTESVQVGSESRYLCGSWLSPGALSAPANVLASLLLV